jgi:GWxTD domain-containing protein
MAIRTPDHSWKQVLEKSGRRFLSYLLLAVLASAAVLPAAGQLKKVNPKELAPQFQEWLKLTMYIISDKERDVFLSLANDRDRSLFIDLFWKMRDPTPGTPQNEYKEEIFKRFREANKKFGRRSTREGWMTDQGRFYIILGEPKSIEDFAGSNDIYPCEIWSYYGDVSKGMPTHFSLVFYQWHNSGEYKLYDPFADGPLKLMVESKDMNPDDYEQIYQTLYDLQPDLALVSLSIIPGQIPYGYQPSPENAIMMASITESPKKNINESYATHFLNYKGVVSTEYLTNYMESATNVAVIRDPVTGMAFCDFAMSPDKLSLSFYEPKSEYSCAFQIDVSLREGEKVIYQYAKEFPLTIPEDRLADAENMGVCIADSFPLIEGKYKLTVLLRNTTGREFSTLERDVEVPPDMSRPRLGNAVLGYKLSDLQPGQHVPYQSESKKVNVDPKNTFSAADQIVFFFDITGLTEELWKSGSAGIVIKGMKPPAPFQKSLSIPLNAYPFHKIVNVVQMLSGADFPPDYYDMTLILKDAKGDAVDQRTANFIISPRPSIGHPIIASKASSLANSFIFFYMLAYQYDQIGDSGKAEAMYKTAYSMNPSFLQKIPEYAGFLLKAKKFAEASDLIEKLKDDANLKFQYDLVKGRALMGLERYPEAILFLGEGNRIYNSDTGLLNALGFCYYKTGKTQEALEILSASLRMDPNQAETKKLIQEIESRKK